MEMLLADVRDTWNAVTPFSARHENMRMLILAALFVGMSDIVSRVVFEILEMPLIGNLSLSICCLMTVPGFLGLKVFLT